MAHEADRQAVIVIPPTQSNTAGEGVTVLASTTSAANAQVPDRLFQRVVRVQAEGDKIWVAFGPSAVNVDKSNAGGSTFSGGTVNDNAITIPDGQYIDVRLDPTSHAYFSWQSNAANAKVLIFARSEKPTWRT